MYDKVVKERATGVQKTIHEQPNFQDEESSVKSQENSKPSKRSQPLSKQLIKKEATDNVNAGSHTKKDSMPHSEKEDQEKLQDDSSSSEDSSEGYVEEAEKQTQAFIYGLFHINSLKRRPDRIFLTFNDVFVKAPTGQDAFFDRGTLQLKRLDKSEAKIEQTQQK